MNTFEFFCRNEAPLQVEDGNLRLRARFLEPRPAASPPANQNKATVLEASPHILPIKTLHQNHGRVWIFEHKPSILLG